MDRYVYSGVAYGVAKGINAEWARAAERGLPAPDLTFFLDIDPVHAAQRKGYGEEKYEVVAMQQCARDAFFQMRPAIPCWHTISSARSIEAIQHEIQRILTDSFQHKSLGPLQTVFT